MNKQMSRKALCIMAAMLALLLVVAISGSGTAQTQNRWTANFWNNTEFRGTPVATRWDQTIDFDWGFGSPEPGVNSDNFSVRWERRVSFDEGYYRFNATMDDGMRVYVDGNLIIDSWTQSQEHTVSRDWFMSAGEHQLQVDYFDAGGVAVAKFWWDALGGGGPVGGYYPNWKGEYFNNTTMSGAPALVRDDPYLNFDWGTGSPAPGVIRDDFFSARWTRTLDTNPGRYRIFLTSDDGSRLYINGQLMIDNWAVQAPTTRAVDYNYPGGPIEVRVEYFENVGNASINVGVGLIPSGG